MGSRLRPHASRLRPRASRPRPPASRLRPRASRVRPRLLGSASSEPGSAPPVLAPRGSRLRAGVPSVPSARYGFRFLRGVLIDMSPAAGKKNHKRKSVNTRKCPLFGSGPCWFLFSPFPGLASPTGGEGRDGERGGLGGVRAVLITKASPVLGQRGASAASVPSVWPHGLRDPPVGERRPGVCCAPRDSPRMNWSPSLPGSRYQH